MLYETIQVVLHINGFGIVTLTTPNTEHMFFFLMY